MSETSIKYLKDESGNTISPVVSVDSIYTQGGGSLIDYIYPVGSIYMSVNSANPSTLFGGTWVAWGAGRVPVGVNVDEDEFKTVEQTGGEKTTNVSITLPAHTHTYTKSNTSTNGHTLTANQSGLRSHSHTYVKGALPNNGAGIKSDGDSHYKNQVLLNTTTTTSTGAASSNATEAHSHDIGTSSANTGSAGSGSTGTQAVSILQQYITCYMWKRTA